MYEEHAEWLRRYCARQLGGAADAEDAVQTTFLYAFRALRRGVVPECERAWLTTIARNACHSLRRTRQRHPEDAEPDLDRIALAQPDLEEVGFLDDVRAALAALPENQRRALVLREWHGASSSEIATELQLSEPATHALLFRARRSFATAMSASRRAVSGLHVAALVEPLRACVKALLAGAAGKAAVVSTAAGVVVGGAVLEERLDDPSPAPPVRPAATITVERGSRGAAPTLSGAVHDPRSVDRPLPRPPRVPARPVRDPAARPTAPAAVPVDDATDRFQRPPTRPTDAPTSASPPSPEALPRPSPPPPAPAPPVEAPVPAPIDLPPILGEEPPVELPPPLDELLPPVELPPVELPPVDPPPLPVPPLPPLLP
jgi:RNA polymerase sigma factor (sigma-70 family)